MSRQGKRSDKNATAEQERAWQPTYQQEFRKCGKPSCHCARDQGHGPYWYAYWHAGGKMHSKYIGKNLPEGMKPPDRIEHEQQAIVSPAALTEMKGNT